MHHAHHIIQRARHHVRDQRKEREAMAKHADKSEPSTPQPTAAERRTAELKAIAVEKGKQSLASLPKNAPRLDLSKGK